MKFYNREHEIVKLRELRELSYNDHSRLIVVTGRRMYDIEHQCLILEVM